MARESLLSKPLFALSIPLLLGTQITSILIHRLTVTHEAQQSAHHTHRVLQDANELNAALHEAESAQRGHMATAKVQKSEIDSYKTMGAIGVIEKPFDAMTLASEIQKLWEQSAK